MNYDYEGDNRPGWSKGCVIDKPEDPDSLTP